MRTNQNPGLEPADEQHISSDGEIFESTKQRIGALAPYLSFGVAQQEALVKASLAGVPLDYCQSVHAANRQISKADPAIDAVAVVHAGIAFVGALKAGVSPTDLGTCVTDALRPLFGIEETPDATDLGY